MTYLEILESDAQANATQINKGQTVAVYQNAYCEDQDFWAYGRVIEVKLNKFDHTYYAKLTIDGRVEQEYPVHWLRPVSFQRSNMWAWLKALNHGGAYG